MTHLMLDLETYSAKSNAVIVQIGATAFDPQTGKIQSEFKLNVDPQSCVDAGLHLDTGTIDWWLKQSKEAQASITDDSDRKSISKALEMYSNWVKGVMPYRGARVWCHATFDFVILNNAFQATGIKPPYSHTAARDLRTIVDLAKVNYYNKPRKGTYHDALDDCKFQVEYLMDCFKNLKLNE
jgi:hypothetical protein